MPGMDGLSLAKHINRVAPKTAIIIMSGNADIKREHVVTAGGVDFIEKPIILDKLLTRIELAFATGAPHNGTRFGFGEAALYRLSEPRRLQTVYKPRS